MDRDWATKLDVARQREAALRSAVKEQRLSWRVKKFSGMEDWLYALYEVNVVDGLALAVRDKATGVTVRLYGERAWSDVSLVVWRPFKFPWISAGVRYDGEWVAFEFPPVEGD